MEIKTYATMLSAVELLPEKNNIYTAIHYITGTMEWMKIDRVEYLRGLQAIGNPRDVKFPCHADHDRDGDLFIHTNVENKY